MNIVQIHERVRFWIDVVGSTRFESEDIDNGVNTAVDQKVRESYDKNRPMNRSDSFQRVQRLRDELGPLVKKETIQNGNLSISGNLIDISALTNYGWLLAIRVQPEENGDWISAIPLSYNRKNTNNNNPFRKSRLIPYNAYFIELDGKIEIVHVGTTIYDAEIYYLSVPVICQYGIEYDSSHGFANQDVVIALETVSYNSETYLIGDEIIIQTPNLNISSGSVLFNYVNLNIRQTTHEEIARRGAINCLLTAGQTDKARALREEIQAS